MENFGKITNLRSFDVLQNIENAVFWQKFLIFWKSSLKNLTFRINLCSMRSWKDNSESKNSKKSWKIHELAIHVH